jgi:hypothetical protein
MASASTQFTLTIKDKPVSVNEILELNISIYPNPTDGQFTISFGLSPIQKALVELCDLQGKQLLSETFRNTTIATIDLAGYPKTMYLVRLSVNGEIINRKISLQ